MKTVEAKELAGMLPFAPPLHPFARDGRSLERPEGDFATARGAVLLEKKGELLEANNWPVIDACPLF